MTEKEKIAKEYSLNTQGIITNPGKFEREMYYAVYYWDCVLNGVADNEWYDDYGTRFASFDLDQSDYEMFPELEGFSTLLIYENEIGFVFCELD